MLGWSISLFRVRGIQLAVHASFFLLLAYAGWEGWRDARGLGLAWNLATLVALFICVVLHELGHSFTAMHYGVGVHRILLMPIGGIAEMDRIPREPGRELLITLAGPAVNFVLAGALWFAVRGQSGAVSPYSFQGLLGQLFVANLIMGCFNLLPVFPMDGGRIFRALLATRLPYLAATRWAAWTGKVLALGGIAVMLLWWEEPHYLGAALFLFIAFAGEAEYQAVRRRDLEEAHWRDYFARMQRAAIAEAEPPLLR